MPRPQLVVPRRDPLESPFRDLFDDLLQHGDPDSYSERRFNMNAAIISATAPAHKPVDLHASAYMLKAACLLKADHRKAEQDREWYRDLDSSRNAARKALAKAEKALGKLHRFVGIPDTHIARAAIAGILAGDPVLANPDWFNRPGDLNATLAASGIVLHRSGPRRRRTRGNPLPPLAARVNAKLKAYGWSDTERRQLLFAVGLKPVPKDERA